MPPNTTSKIQPLDAGIIKNLKHYYQKQLLEKTVAYIDSNISSNNKMCASKVAMQTNVLDALHMMANAKEETILNILYNSFM